jgi:probable 2-oxoglutarate dehydrogenase E1 component DHKTD1
VKRVVLHSGKIHYDLVKTRAAKGLTDDVALIRIEELAPFPYEALHDALQPYTSSDGRNPEIYWLQEESRNQGAWTHVAPRIASVLRKLEWNNGQATLEYRGRKEDAVAATGTGNVYKREQAEVLESAFRGL